MKPIKGMKSLIQEKNCVPKVCRKRKKEETDSFSDIDDVDGDDAECLFCGTNYKNDKNGEKWTQCIRCFQWAHEECGASDLLFTCPTCRRRRKQK